MRQPNVSPVDVHGEDSDLLDCLDDNIAALLRHQGLKDARTPFALQWYFDFQAGKNGGFPLPALKRRPIKDVLIETTGYELSTPDAGDDATRRCADLVSEGNPVIVQGDAYLMPWLPYYGRQHMNHSFIVEAVDDGLLQVADAYYNQTPWGEAAPTRTVLPAYALGALTDSAQASGEAPFVVLKRRAEPAPPDLAGLLRQDAAGIRRQLGERHRLTEFSRFYAGSITEPGAAAQFTLACWLIARDRGLHGRWLDGLPAEPQPGAESGPAASPGPAAGPGFAEAFAERVVQPWQRAMQFSYVLQRRVEAGRAAPEAVFALIEQEIEPAETELAERLLASSRN